MRTKHAEKVSKASGVLQRPDSNKEGRRCPGTLRGVDEARRREAPHASANIRLEWTGVRRQSRPWRLHRLQCGCNAQCGCKAPQAPASAMTDGALTDAPCEQQHARIALRTRHAPRTLAAGSATAIRLRRRMGASHPARMGPLARQAPPSPDSPLRAESAASAAA